MVKSGTALRAVNVFDPAVLLPVKLIGTQPFDSPHGTLAVRTETEHRRLRRLCWKRHSWCGQQATTQRKEFSAPAIGKQPEVADARQVASASIKPGPTSRPSDSAHRSAGIVRDWKIRRGYQNEHFEHPRNRVRHASGLVLTRYPELETARSPLETARGTLLNRSYTLARPIPIPDQVSIWRSFS
jgi:hypothetical protein